MKSPFAAGLRVPVSVHLIFALILMIRSASAVTSVAVWGDTSHGLAGVPPGLTNVIRIAAGNVGFHNLALKSDGTVVAWGENNLGQATVPTNLGAVIDVVGGYAHNLALKTDRTVVAWGNNFSYYTNGPTGQTNVPADVTNVVAIGAGWYHSLAVRGDGTIVAWGANEYGQSTIPPGLNNVVAVAGGPARSLALKRDSTVVAWGTNFIDSASGEPYPLSPPQGLSGVTAIAAGYYHSLALRVDGTVVAWGADQYGQSSVPADLKNVIAIAAGGYFSLALKADGTITGWGLNPGVPAGLSNVVAISAGYYHGLALINAGTPPAIKTQPADAVALQGGSCTFQVSASGGPPLSYQWQFSGEPLPDQTNSVLTLINVESGNSGGYSVIITNAAGSVTSHVALLTVVTNQTVVIDSSFNGRCDSSGYNYVSGNFLAGNLGNLIYRNFFVFNLPAFQGTIASAQLRINTFGVAATNDYTYELRAVVSTFTNLLTTGYGKVDIFDDLADGALYGSRLYSPSDANRTNLLTLTAAGLAELTTKRGSSFAVGGSLQSIQNTTGTEYYFASSQGAVQLVLTLIPCSGNCPPAILSQPAPINLPFGSLAVFKVDAVGEPPLFFQWNKNGTVLTGATNSSFSIKNIQTDDGGNYSVVVSNIYGAVTSTNAFLRVIGPHKNILLSGVYMNGTIQNYLAALGHASTVANSGSASFDPYDVIWLGYLATSLSNRTADLQSFLDRGGVVLSEASSTGPLTNAGLGVGLTFVPATGESVRIVDSAHPINAGLTAAGLSNWTNSWQGYFSALGSFSGLTDAGIAGRWLTVERIIGRGHVVFTSQQISSHIQTGAGATGPDSPKGLFLDNVFHLLDHFVEEPPSILGQPKNQTNYAGRPITLSVRAFGGDPLKYQWLKGNQFLIAATNSALTISNPQISDSGVYSAIVSNAFGTAGSSNATITVLPLPNCAPPSSGLVSWWRGENNFTDSSGLNDGTGQSNFLAGNVGQGFGSWFVVSNSPSLRITNALSIEAWVNPFVLSGPSPHTIVSKFLPAPGSTNSSFFLGTTNNGHLYFAVTPSGLNPGNTTVIATDPLPTNQWTHVAATYDGVVLRLYINSHLVAEKKYDLAIFPGTLNLGVGTNPGTEASWTWSGVLDEVSIYNRALALSEIQQVYNADISGKCLIAPKIIAQPQSQTIPLGEDVLFSVTATGARPFMYQWRFAGPTLPATTILPGQTNSTLVLEKLTPASAGTYSVLVSNAVGQGASSNATLTLVSAPVCLTTPPGLISWWPADGWPTDAMGTNNSITTVPFVPGKSGQAFSFGGTRIQVPSSESLNFRTNDFSIEGWIKVLPALQKSTNANVPFIEKRTGLTLTSGRGYSLSLFQGHLAFWIANDGFSPTNIGFFVSEGPDLRDSLFHHVAITLNRNATNGGNLYVDGVSVLTFNPSPHRGDISTSGTSLLIGYPSSTVSSSVFNGLIDELAIYDRALSSPEVSALRSAGAAGKCKVPPSIFLQPANQKVTATSNATLTVGAAGSPALRYQWFRNGQLVSGATNSSYTFSVVAAATYSVRVTNLFGAITSSNALLTLNFIPVALRQSVSLDEDTPIAITLDGTDGNKDPLAFSIVRPPAHGALNGNPPLVNYTPGPNYYGSDSFLFKVNDGFVDSAPAEISITVRPINDAPIAVSQSVSVNEDTPINISLTGTDIEGDLLTLSLVSFPAHGALTGIPPNVTYLPATNYYGPDTFSFKANDGKTDSAPAIVNITVKPVNDAPNALAQVSPLFTPAEQTNRLILSLNNSNASVVLDGSGSSDVENDPLTYWWFEGTNQVASGVLITNSFVVGVHSLNLLVSDGQDAGTNSIDFEVITASESISFLISLVENSSLAGKNQQPLLASLNATAAAYDKGNLTSGTSQLLAFESKVRAQIAPNDPDLASRLIEEAEKILDGLSP